ncbi:polysaccharide biosynthesis/export family protein [Methylococcus capsulatus]|uniref:polysaccharide biosynthesis/export family protein n=1 Tax=Methylococcus capsulatus TaxID=414 RepID=UPI001C52E182|nr:polysaccharide biosynthesis/export family protein [Methylococcus capsulatus]QXP88096.1 polysaccharide export protein [Methylococcus capsulatus]UQN13124.1 polysaccharide export protein [Methylococcus capsulatus]
MFRVISRIALLFVASSFLSLLHAEDKVSGYRLGPDDLIKISVLNEPNLSIEARLSDAGTVSYPFLGEIHIKGKTPGEVERLITDGLRGAYLVDPKVNVSVLEYRKYYIGGQVKQPGAYPYQPGLTVGKAVALAGGFGELASRDIVILREDDPAQPQLEADVMTPVHPGDVITVEESFF